MSSEWQTRYDGVFFLSVGTLLMGSLSVCAAYCLKSKCSSFKCWGIEIIRDVNAENQADFEAMEHGINPSIENNNNNSHLPSSNYEEAHKSATRRKSHLDNIDKSLI